MSDSQFVRCHAYPAHKITDILNEANRHSDFVSHVERPEIPSWVIGSHQAVEDAIVSYMSTPAPVRARDGRILERKRRKDHRCLVAGVVTWPDSVAQYKDLLYPRQRFRAYQEWYRRTQEWLVKQFSDKLIAVCFHNDESHPHLHFFVVGDAQRLHPGMKHELINDHRMTVKEERYAAHKNGLKLWLDDFYVDVGEPCGLLRATGARPAWRIRDRATSARLSEIDKKLAERPDSEIQAERDDLWDEQHQPFRPRITF